MKNKENCEMRKGEEKRQELLNAAEKLFFNENQPSVRLLKRLVEQAG